MADAEEPTPRERRELDAMLQQARRVTNPPRVISSLEAAIATVIGERFDVIEPGEMTGTTWTAQELAESIDAAQEAARSGG